MGICFSSSSSDKEAFASSEKQESVADNIVFWEQDDESSPNCEKVKSIASLYSQQGKKGVNQDAAILCKGYGGEDGLFCGVFDGHGRSGHAVSRLVRDHLPCLLLSELRALQRSNDENEFTDGNDTSSTDGETGGGSSPAPELLHEWKEACTNGFNAMDQELMLKPELDCSSSGTTAVTIIKQGKDLIIANLGDSRAVMGAKSEEGQLEAVQLTTDLKPSLPQEAERIRKKEGRVFALKGEPHVQRVWLPTENFPGLAMSRAFGDFHLKNHGVISVPQVTHRRLAGGDLFVVLATDGVWDVLSNEEVVSIVWSSKSNEEASRTLVEAARRAWKSKFPSAKVDDCTAACLFFQERRADIATSNSQ
ncbi:hypothetical protein Cni_G22814 [Canna indica]|uniref:protein-serine/threonine phosphatase n=1 Tax=Canna indica TaxID=4628 RepID=A0AAQ3KSH2_9LILI|nr:hypothetical protein Cni_G22814 [Canna indica]